MKKRAVYQYIIGFCGVLVFASLVFLASYRAALSQFQSQLMEYQTKLTADGTAGVDKFAGRDGAEQGASGLNGAGQNAAGMNGQEEMLPAGNTGSGTITPQTEYTLEIYDSAADYLAEYKLNPPAYLVGLDRMGLEQYMKDYMKDVPLDEFQMGLISYDVVSFSPEKVVLRKVYDQSVVPYQYYLVVERGYLVVYYADQKTVYEYTGIEARKLPEEEQVKLAYGIFLKDQSELYGLLQSYSS